MKHNLYERSCSQYSVIIYASRRFYFTAGAHILCQSISVQKSILPKSAFNRNKLLLFRHFFLRFLREGNNQNTVVIFRMNVLMLQLFSYIETSGALSGVTFSVDIFTMIVLLIFILSSGSLDVQVTILQLNLTT